MTEKDIAQLSQIRRSWATNSTEGKKSLLEDLVKKEPSKLAKNAARNGDYRPIGLAMGYHAGEADAAPFALECKKPVETQNIVFGCVPPPGVIFKLMLDYNMTLLDQPGFPSENECTISEEAKKEIIHMD